MPLSVLIAKIAAIIYLSEGIGVLLNKDHFKKVLEDFQRNPGLNMVTGVFTIIVSFLIVSAHNIWAPSWTVLVTILGWAGLLKGIFIVAFPKHREKMVKYLLKKKLTKIVGPITVILGLTFAYFGFVMA